MKFNLRLLLPLVFLASCGPLVELPSSGPAPQVFTISPMHKTAGLSISPKARLFIEEPVADGLLANTRIAVRVDETEVRYLPQARWAERPSHMVRANLHDGLAQIDGLTPLSAGALEVPTEYRLKLRIRSFNAVEENGALRAHVDISGIILETNGSNILAIKDFKAQERVSSKTASAITEALNRVHRDTVESVSRWVTAVLTESLENS